MGLLLNILTCVGYFFVAVGTGLIWSPEWTVKKLRSSMRDVDTKNMEEQNMMSWYLCGAFQVGFALSPRRTRVSSAVKAFAEGVTKFLSHHAG